MKLFSTEQVSKYHPDKYADQISDAILTEILKQDKYSQCGIETMVKDNTVVLGGEITTKYNVNYDNIVHRVANKLNYKVDNIINLLGQQSPQINNAVVNTTNYGAGDQGMMYGYAVNETESNLPFGFDLANRIIKIIENDIVSNKFNILCGDAKTQVTVDLDKAGYDSVQTILISACHSNECTIEFIRYYIYELLAKNGVDINKSKFIINPAGTWTIGGPTADCGLTGRKIVCDQYGGYCPVGGGAFSGKNPTKVDRSGAYMARVIAKDLLKEFELKECEIQLGYAIGIPEPVSIFTKNDKHLNLSNYVKANYDLTPKGIIDKLDLYNVNYEKLSEGCHYYKTQF